ncbi:hypothetical protein LCGC14_0340940 [marine sediment metagenome]|uniref:Uncharacterized protein n=1 Tax=marine sediment metagenome TaxID=412755 RepID=A0A0F9TWM6_9ZZZZ
MIIVLINPKLATWSPNVYVPLGLGYIASALESVGHEVSILDLNSQKYSDKKLLKEIKFADVIGITGLITEYEEVIRVINIVKEYRKEAKVILGGALATTHAEAMLTDSKVDYVVIGEGERTIITLLSAIQHGQSLKNIKGIAYKDNGSVVVNPPADMIKNLDTILYPARHLVDMSRYTSHHFKIRTFGMKSANINSVTMLTSRGCPYNCSFCFHDVWGNHWRGRSPENIIGEMKQLHDVYGYNAFIFHDDTFVVDKKRVVEFCKQLRESELNVSWYCNGRVNLMSEEIIKVMSESGCTGIAYGIESGSQEILDSIKKNITLEQIRNITSLTKKYGIHVSGYMMIGILGDSRRTIEQTMEFARELNLDFYGFGITTPILGTPMYEEAKEKSMVFNSELKDWSAHASINMTTDCTNKDLENYNEASFREFTLTKRYGKNYLMNYYLWIDGIKTLLFLIGKRNIGELLKKVFGIIFAR